MKSHKWIDPSALMSLIAAKPSNASSSIPPSTNDRLEQLLDQINKIRSVNE
jgi:hypothetical protein